MYCIVLESRHLFPKLMDFNTIIVIWHWITAQNFLKFVCEIQKQKQRAPILWHSPQGCPAARAGMGAPSRSGAGLAGTQSAPHCCSPGSASARSWSQIQEVTLSASIWEYSVIHRQLLFNRGTETAQGERMVSPTNAPAKIGYLIAEARNNILFILYKNQLCVDQGSVPRHPQMTRVKHRKHSQGIRHGQRLR